MRPAGDAVILRRVVAMMAADRRQIALYAAALTGTSRTCWQSEALGQRAREVAATAEALCRSARRLRREAAQLKR